MGARINHFRETEFVCDLGQPIVGGALHQVQAWGAERLSAMLTAVVDECLESAAAAQPSQTAVVLLCAEPQRPGMPRQHLLQTLAQLQQQLGLHDACVLCEYGKGGIAKALQLAVDLLNHATGPANILLVGLDSLLDAGAIEDFVALQRIATRSSPDGFIPAEAAAAVLLSRRGPAEPALWIDGIAGAAEAWRLDGDKPMRARGLTQAIRVATAMAGAAVSELDFQATGMTGEGWYAKEAAMAMSRCMEHTKAEFPHLMVAQFAGETGAASAVLTLAWLAGAMGHPYFSPGRSALLHFAGDDGQRAALVVRHRARLDTTA